jgi:hypothetical protein
LVSSIESSTAPAGTPTALSCAIASCFVRSRVQPVTIASTSARAAGGRRGCRRGHLTICSKSYAKRPRIGTQQELRVVAGSR